MPTLKSLEIADNKQLKEFDLNAPDLKLLDLTGHQAPDSLQRIWFKNLSVKGKQPVIKGLVSEKIIETLKQNSDQLVLARELLNEFDMIALVNHPVFFKKNGQQYKSLDLSKKQIGDQEITALAKALKHTQIKELDLSNNQISDQGAIALAEALKLTQIKTLDLSNNQIGHQGTIKLAKICMQLEGSLTIKGLWTNGIIELFNKTLEEKEIELGWKHLKYIDILILINHPLFLKNKKNYTKID
ncbi:MAG: leucine-rich repeat domain-containing protein, partial [Burkholderiales bacterium]